ncbi:hypothetical protein [Streptomyces sp. NBC_00658]|uniref:hypothetical protein n=1 Tax=Streptomyces sp. NBC_00658 TaxID=2975800 RepID=UPI003244522F
MDTPRIAAQFASARGNLERLLGPAADPGHALTSLGSELDILADECAGRAAREEAGVVRDLVEAVRYAVQGALQATGLTRDRPPQVARPRRLSRRWRPGKSANVSPRRAPTVEVHTDRLLTAVEDALGEVDRALARIERPAPRTLPWQHDEELLDLLLDLLAAQQRQDGRYALARIAALREDLPLRHGIRVVEYAEHAHTEHGGPAPDVLFDLPEDPVAPPESVRTVAPALVSEEQGVLRQGRVVSRATRYGGSDEHAG